jgi:hypothetical protein
MQTLPDPHAQALHELAALDAGAGVPLTRLAKRLKLGVSALLRIYTALGDACVGDVQGPGWVELHCEEGRWRAFITETGRAHCEPAPSPADGVA